jgi:hypothetical protein
MRPTLSNFFRLLLLVGCAFLPTIGSGSEIRVDSTGGLTTILDDETDNLDLFLDGNPAGLVLLNTKDRFDLSGEWAYSDQEGPWGSNKQQVFTTIPRYTDNPIKYEGLMLFPDPHWAVQVLGDFLTNQGVSVTTLSNDTMTNSQYRGLVRAAYAFPFASLGVEILDVETDKVYDPGLYNPFVGLSSGSSAQNQWLVKVGAITTFPGLASPQDPRWQAGVYFQTELGSSLQNQQFSLFYLGTPAFAVNQVNTTDNYQVWGGEILYELPAILKIRFSASLTGVDSDFEQTVPYTSAYFSTLEKYHSYQYQALNTTGAFKWTLPFSDTENLKIGGALSDFFYNQDYLRTTGAVYDNKDRQQIGTSLGIGLDCPKEYTLGLQWKSLSYTSGSNAINGSGTQSTLSNTDYAYYQLAFGGEKWVSGTWALRLGIIAEEDDYSATSISALATTVNLGAGLEDTFGRVDLRFFLGQATDMANSSNTTGLIGAQFSTTIFL